MDQDKRFGWQRFDRTGGDVQECCLNIQDDWGHGGDPETNK